MKQNLFFLAAVLVLFAACVPQRQYVDAVKQRDKYKDDSAHCYAELQNAESEMKTLNNQIGQQNYVLARMKQDSIDIYSRYTNMENANKQLREVETQLNDRINQLLALSTNENQSLNEQLTKKEQELTQKETELKKQEALLSAKEARADSLAMVNAEKEKRIQQLEGALNEMNTRLTEVTTAVEKALSGFSSSDLTIEKKNGKVYVKMSEKLLFASGSTQVDDKGKQALQQLANALKSQSDIQIFVEGHTDNVPLKSANYPKDNWDLSVLRSTTIVKLLTQDYGLNPQMVEAGGKGEYEPIAANTDASGRAQNRRTEIVIIPNIDDVTRILQELNK